MEATIKLVLDEMISYKLTRVSGKYLRKAHVALGDNELRLGIGELLLWHKLVFLGVAEKEKLEIGEITHKQYLILFENVPELRKIFKLHDAYVGWSTDLSVEEKDEIRNYIHEHHKIQVRIRRDGRLK